MEATFRALLALAVIACAECVSITSVEPLSGGLGGGTRLTITGSGFSDTTGGTNQVDIGGAVCATIPYLCSFDSIICVTSAAAGGTAGAKPLSVRVNGIYDAMYSKSFSYSDAGTPEIWEVTPAAGSQLSLLTLKARVTYASGAPAGRQCCPYAPDEPGSDDPKLAAQPISVGLRGAEDADAAPTECSLAARNIDEGTGAEVLALYGQADKGTGSSWSARV